MTQVLVTFPAPLDADQVARIEAAAPGVEVTVESYTETTEARGARVRGEAPAEPVAAPSPALVDALERAEVVLAWDLPADVGRLAPALRWVQAISAGVDHYGDIEWDDVTVTTAAGVAAAPIAEFVMARLLAEYKRLDEIAAQQERHEWSSAFGRDLKGRTLAVIGLGAIGSAVAERAAAFGMQVLAVRRDSDRPRPDSVDEVHGADALHEVLGRADAVVVSAPATPATESLFDADAFAAMKPGSWFCNVSRGSLVDEQALVAALESGHLAAAALDVVRNEPLAADSPLWDVANLHISPHSAASLDRYVESLLDLFVDNLGRYERGEELRNVVVADPAGT